MVDHFDPITGFGNQFNGWQNASLPFFEVRMPDWSPDAQPKRTDASGRFSLGVAENAGSWTRALVAIDRERRLHGHATVEVKMPVESPDAPSRRVPLDSVATRPLRPAVALNPVTV